MSNHFEQIEKYLGGDMSPAEKTSFEVLLKSNEEVAADFQLFNEMKGHIEEADSIESALKNLREVRSEMDSEPSTKFNRLGALATIITVLLLCLALFWFNKAPKEQKPEILFAQNFNPDLISLTMRGEDKETNDEEITQLFNDKKYDEVLQRVVNGKIEDLDPRMIYLIGISQIGNGEYREGRETLKGLEENHPIFKDDVNWYIGLSHLAEGNKELARPYLSTLPVSHKNYKKAISILKD